MNEPPSYAELLEPIRSQMDEVNHMMQSEMDELREPVRSVLRRSTGGGKRVRPAMVILIGRCLEMPDAPFVRLAAAIEMIHAATLIHDDVLDRSPLRRGKESCHVAWPVNAAILAGDLLLSKAVSVAASLERPRILEVLGEAFCRICGAEIVQVFGSAEICASRKEYLHTAEAKTASLFSAASESAGILADTDTAVLNALREYGREIGVAYQIADDLLDFLGCLPSLGKLSHGDLAHGILTLPTILYLESGGNQDLIGSILRGPPNKVRVQKAVQGIVSSKAMENSLAEARAHALRAKNALGPLPDRPPREALMDLAEWAAVRSS